MWFINVVLCPHRNKLEHRMRWDIIDRRSSHERGWVCCDQWMFEMEDRIRCAQWRLLPFSPHSSPRDTHPAPFTDTSTRNTFSQHARRRALPPHPLLAILFATKLDSWWSPSSCSCDSILQSHNTINSDMQFLDTSLSHYLKSQTELSHKALLLH